KKGSRDGTTVNAHSFSASETALTLVEGNNIIIKAKAVLKNTAVKFLYKNTPSFRKNIPIY
ncbi:MAG: hypothetical protein IJC41_05125, partial [Firmicutes bacterium]|nr:hypothetical protein [Bacillota bacterium]